MSERRVVVIVNPRSGLGRTGRGLPALRAQLEAKLGAHELWLTQAPGHAAQLARAALERGAEQLVVCGGDGTLSEAADALLRSGHARHVALSPLHGGTGADFARSLGAGQDGSERLLDVGLAHYLDAHGREQSRHVLNVASVGLSAEAVRWVEAQAQRGRRNKLSYLLSGFASLSRYAVSDVEIAADGAPVLSGPLLFCAMANGQFFGGGMQVAPCARLDDGVLDVTAVEAMPLWESVPFFARLLRSKHLTHRRTHLGRGRVVTLTSHGPVWLEIDGEAVGTLPARIVLLPGALRVRCLHLAQRASTR